MWYYPPERHVNDENIETKGLATRHNRSDPSAFAPPMVRIHPIASGRDLCSAAGKCFALKPMMDCHNGLRFAALASPIIAALAGISGVLLGGWIASRSRAEERRRDRVRDKLDKFYAPMLATRQQILAKSEVREKVHSVARSVWTVLFQGSPSPEEKARIAAERDPQFVGILKYSEEQVKSDLIPLYRQMVDLFTANMQFAEDSTRQYFGLLVEFVEIWNRQLSKEMPPEVVIALNQDEKKLYPFYTDLKTQFKRLRGQLE
ncbi:MAG: hypothetical protein WCD43_11425 [Candidatus Acidiferrales bacterium]